MTLAAAHPDADRYMLGLPLAVAGMLCLSTGGLFVRLVEEAGPWTLMFYRAVGFVATLLVIIVASNRGRLVEPFRRSGRRGLVLAVVLGLGFVTYVLAMVATSVANVVFILSSAPVFAALLGWLVLKERIGLMTAVIILGTACGIAIMVAGGISGGRLDGNLYALATALSFAGMVVVVRGGRNANLLPGTCLAGLLSLVIAAGAAETLRINLHDLLICLVMGSVQIGFGFTCLTYAPRYIPAAEVALIGLVEAVLGPFWVWLAIGEMPATATFAGGAVVLAFVTFHTVRNLLREHNLARKRARARLQEGQRP